MTSWSTTQRRKLSSSTSRSRTARFRFGVTKRRRGGDLGLEQGQLVLAEHALGHVAHDQPDLGRERRAGRGRSGPASGPALPRRVLEALARRARAGRRCESRFALGPFRAPDLGDGRRRPGELEPAVGGHLAERPARGLVEVEREPVPVSGSRREAGDLPG